LRPSRLKNNFRSNKFFFVSAFSWLEIGDGPLGPLPFYWKSKFYIYLQ